MRSRLGQFFLTLLGVIVFLVIAITLENEVRIPFSLTFRILCAGTCLFLMFKIESDYPGEKWPRIALVIATLFNVAIFFSPLTQMPASKGDILFFAVPDGVIFLAARTMTYPVTDSHHRAVRQQLIVGLILATAVCAILMSILLIPQPTTH